MSTTIIFRPRISLNKLLDLDVSCFFGGVLPIEIEEYLSRKKRFDALTTSMRPIQLSGQSRQFVDDFTHFMEKMKDIWLETRWSRIKDGSYDVHSVDIAKLSLSLILSRAFDSIPMGPKKQFGEILAHFEDNDATGHLGTYYEDAIKDKSDYRFYQYFRSFLWDLKQDPKDTKFVDDRLHAYRLWADQDY